MLCRDANSQKSRIRSSAPRSAAPAFGQIEGPGPGWPRAARRRPLRTRLTTSALSCCGRNPDAALRLAAISVRLRWQARSAGQQPRTTICWVVIHRHRPPAYSHAPWSPTAAASSRASAGAPRSSGRLRHCSPSLVRRFRWRSLPRPPRPRRRLRPSPLRPRRTTKAPRRATGSPTARRHQPGTHPAGDADCNDS